MNFKEQVEAYSASGKKVLTLVVTHYLLLQQSHAAKLNH